MCHRFYVQYRIRRHGGANDSQIQDFPRSADERIRRSFYNNHPHDVICCSYDSRSYAPMRMLWQECRKEK